MDSRIQLELKDYVRLEMLGLIRSRFQELCFDHMHPFWELIFSVSGEGVHRIGDREIYLPAGHICLIPPNTAHACENRQPEDNTKLYIGFSFSVSFSGEPPSQTTPIGTCIDAGTFGFDLCSLVEILEKGETAPDHLPTEKLLEALSRLASTLPEPKPRQMNLQELRRQNITDKIIDYLNLNLNRSIRVEELASMFYLSPYYISDQFRKCTGIGIKQYHENLRMYHALQWLKDRRFTVTETAQRLGYENIHYFSRRFKSHFGYPPSQIVKNRN